MSKRLTTAVAALAACGIATAATRAQEPSPTTTLTATVRATPQKAGTARRPVGVKLQGKVELTTPEGVAHPVITGFELWTGPGLTFNGDRYPGCRLSELSMSGPAACPSKSIMGTGSLLDPMGIMDRPSGGDGRITFFNGVGGKLLAWMVLQNPARVQAAAVGEVVDDKPGPWPQRVAWTIPSSLRLVSGIPITLDHIDFAIGGKSWAKTYFATTRCGFAWRIRVHTASSTTGAPATLDTRGRVPCRR
jgi:hypothetical protein